MRTSDGCRAACGEHLYTKNKKKNTDTWTVHRGERIENLPVIYTEHILLQSVTPGHLHLTRTIPTSWKHKGLRAVRDSAALQSAVDLYSSTQISETAFIVYRWKTEFKTSPELQGKESFLKSKKTYKDESITSERCWRLHNSLSLK